MMTLVYRSMFVSCFSLAIAHAAVADISVRGDFEGGSVKLNSIDQQTATLRVSPADSGNRGWSCWWYFKAEGLTPGTDVTVELTNEGPGGGRGVWAMPDLPFWSSDGKTWRQIDQPGERVGKAIIYRQKVPGEQAWFAWGPPFVVSDGTALVERIARQTPGAETFELCRSRDGHSVPALTVRSGDLPDDQRFGIWVQARQHAWEVGSSWVGRGFIEWLVSEDESARWLREHAVVYFVPVVDVDSVFRGTGGKEQEPQDHNRDWTDDPYWPEVRAVQAKLKEMDAAGRLHLFVDLHNPNVNNREPFFFLPAPEFRGENAKRYEQFIRAAHRHLTGPMKLRSEQRVFTAKYDAGWQRISNNWIGKNLTGPVVAVTLETTWNLPHATTQGYMEVGRQLGEAMADWLNE